MTSQRVTEINKVLNIQTFIIVLVFVGFWGPFAYNWVYLLEPIKTAINSALVLGLISIGLLYVPWRKTTARLRRLRKYEILFSDFFEAMITDMEANDEEKGDTWLTMELSKLIKMADKVQITGERFGRGPSRALVKLSNYCAMIHIRRKIAMELQIHAKEEHRKHNEMISK